MTPERDRRITDMVERERSRLRGFISRRVPDPSDVEDVLQTVFFKLVEADRLLVPIDHVTGWLYRVARNQIVDLFRKKAPEKFADIVVADDSGDAQRFDDLLPSAEAGPEAAFARHVMLNALERAVVDLPDDQRSVFVAHELEGRSFAEIAAESGVNLNTLLSRKRYAVLRLRERLQDVYVDFMTG